MSNSTQMLKGLLEGCILKIVSQNETYGYDICERLNTFGFEHINEGIVYPILTRLEKKKLIYSVKKDSPFGPKRKYFYLTDQGTEFYNFKNKENDSPFTNALRAHGIVHTVTKVAHPWTNGYVERLNQTIWQEFYLCRLERPYASIEALNKDLDAFIRYYNFNRKHTGYKLKEGGFEYPAHAFFDVREANKTIEIKY